MNLLPLSHKSSIVDYWKTVLKDAQCVVGLSLHMGFVDNVDIDVE